MFATKGLYFILLLPVDITEERHKKHILHDMDFHETSEWFYITELAILPS